MKRLAILLAASMLGGCISLLPKPPPPPATFVLEAQNGQSMSGHIEAAGVKVAGVIEDQSPFRRRYEPSHPDADKDGFVQVPNVDVPEEMVDMLGAARAYQANLTAIGLIRDTIQRALELAK